MCPGKRQLNQIQNSRLEVIIDFKMGIIGTNVWLWGGIGEVNMFLAGHQLNLLKLINSRWPWAPSFSVAHETDNAIISELTTIWK